ncbi:DUF2189 domain-containing protein [Falsiroseomonas tokyonensis]|uniref:DUF2189 domain-containing protein n=1 Tax=Falsiroseomonas tokyonensis TaxID=430521 RepID=A0ABV7BY36_9PROT|nr:DUF2189 domain-containing protein [Falsiroseomonas tokyonensis]MBU8540552.1 DUF2189 domain-containing protein [Falsiroseomonas tokyonensis]
MAEVVTTTPHFAAPSPALRQIGLPDLATALRRGWADFLGTPTQLMFLCVLYPFIGLVAATMAAGGDVMHLFYPMAAGFALVGPLAALGLYEISRRREAGKPAHWSHVFEVLKSPALPGIAALGLLLVVLFLAWIWAAHAIFAATLGALPQDPRGLGALALLEQVFGTPEGHRMLLLGHLAGLGFAAVVLALTVVSFPMLLDRPQNGLGQAIGTSLRAVAANPVPMAAWGLIVAVLLLAGSLPLFIGLAVVLPVLGHATWHLYRQVVVR